MAGLLKVAGLLLLIVVVVLLYIVAGGILIVSTASRNPFSLEARRAALRVSAACVPAHFIITVLLYFIFTRLGGELYLMLNYPFFDTMPFFDFYLNLIEMLSGGKSSAHNFGVIMFFKVYELIFLFPFVFIIGFIINLIVAPLRRLLGGKGLGVVKLFGLSLATFSLIVLLSFTLSVFNKKYVDSDAGVLLSSNSKENQDMVYTNKSNRYINGEARIRLNRPDLFYSKTSSLYINNSDDSIIFTYYSYDEEALTSITERNSKRIVEIVDVEADKWGHSSIIMEDNLKTYMSYITDKDKLKFASKESESWETYYVDKSPTEIFWNTDIARDGNGIYICSYQEVEGSLVCYKSNGSGWEKEIVDTGKIISSSSYSNVEEQVALDMEIYNSIINLCYYSLEDYTIRMGTRENGQWTTGVIAENARANFDFTLDSDGNGHLTYLDKDYNLYYATNKSGTWETEQIKGVESSGSVIMVLDTGGVYIYYKCRDTGYLTLWSNRPMFP